MTDETTEQPERIYLEPGEPENWDPHFGRAWCEDDVWEREADDPGVAYVRADLVEEGERGEVVAREAYYDGYQKGVRDQQEGRVGANSNIKTLAENWWLDRAADYERARPKENGERRTYRNPGPCSRHGAKGCVVCDERVLVEDGDAGG